MTALQILGYVFNAAPFVLAVLLGIAIPVLGVLCYSRFAVGVGVIVGMYAAEAMFMSPGGIQLGITIYYTDIVLSFIAVIAILRWLTRAEAPPQQAGWLLYLVAFVLSLGIGIATNGTSAGVQSRTYFYSMAAGAYALSFPVGPRQVRQLVDALVMVALLFVCLCVYRWIVYYLPIRELMPEEGTYNVDGAIRVIRSFEAILVAQVLVLGLFFAPLSPWTRVARWLTPVLLSIVVVLQHRSVWLASAVGVLGALSVGKAGGGKFRQLLLLIGMAIVIALPVALSDKFSGVESDIAGSAEKAVSGQGTAGERLESWQEILKQWAAGGPRSLVLGQSFGSDTSRTVHTEQGVAKRISYAAHNHYVQTLSNLGLLGLVGFVMISFFAVKGLVRLSASDGSPAAPALLVIVGMQLVYYIPYGTDYLQQLILGTAISLVASQKMFANQTAEPVAPLSKRAQRWRWT